MKKLIAIGVLAASISAAFSQTLTERIPFEISVSHDFNINIVDFPKGSTFQCLINIPRPSQMTSMVRIGSQNLQNAEGGILSLLEGLNNYYRLVKAAPYNTSKPMIVTFSNFGDYNKDEILRLKCYYF